MQIELIELVDKIIGTYTAHGDSGVDHEAEEHLKEVGKLLYWVLHKLAYNAERKNSYEGTVADIGKESYEILMECKEIIEEIEVK